MSNETEKVIVSSLIRNAELGRTSSIELLVYKNYGYAFVDGNHNWQPNIEYNEAYLRSTIEYLSSLFNMRQYLFLNDALRALGLNARPDGQVAGWHVEDGPLDISFQKVDLVDKPGEKRLWITLKPHGVIVNRI